MAVGHVDPADWLLDRWRLQALPRLTTVDDLAWQPRQRRTLQHVARTGDDGYSCPRWYFPRALLRLRLRRLFLLQSVFFLHSGDLLFLPFASSQIFFPPIFLPPSPAFHGSAGSLPTMSRSTRCSVSLTAWLWVS